MHLELDPVETFAAAIAVLGLGALVVGRVAALRDNNIPVPVVGGILFALAATVSYLAFDVQVAFDMALKEPLMLAFFTSIGLGADLRLLARGGPQLLVFAAVCVAYLILQDGLGVAAAVGLDLHPLVGLLSASITLSGGHGTGAAYAERFSADTNLAGAMELALACATFGLVIGGLLGGPVAGRLIRRHGLEPEPARETVGDGPAREEPARPITSDTLLGAVFQILVCLVGGRVLAAATADFAFTLPSFVWCLFIGVVIRNAAPLVPGLGVHRATVDALGTVSLSVFLAMALMSLHLWELAGLAGPLVVLLAVQTLGMAAFATFVTFRVMGGRYDGAVIAGGHCGFGMGATPTAVANMEALVERYGPSPQAFLVVPLMGAFFIDLLNALVIQGYLAMPFLGY